MIKYSNGRIESDKGTEEIHTVNDKKLGILSKNLSIKANEDIFFRYLSDKESETEHPIVSVGHFVRISRILPLHPSNGSSIISMKCFFSQGGGIFEFSRFEKVRDSGSVSYLQRVFKLFSFFERVLKELSINGVVESGNFATLSDRHIDHFHKQFAVIPEKIECREKFLYPSKFLFIFIGKSTVDTYLIEIFNESRSVYNASAIKSLRLLFLIVFFVYFSSGTDFYGFPDSSIGIPRYFSSGVFHTKLQMFVSFSRMQAGNCVFGPVQIDSFIYLFIERSGIDVESDFGWGKSTERTICLIYEDDFSQNGQNDERSWKHTFIFPVSHFPVAYLLQHPDVKKYLLFDPFKLISEIVVGEFGFYGSEEVLNLFESMESATGIVFRERNKTFKKLFFVHIRKMKD